MLSIRAELKKGNRTTVLNLPCNDYGIDIALANLGETDMTETEQFCTHIGGEFRELAVLEDRFIYIDELNFLAKYLDSLTGNQRNQFRAAIQIRFDATKLNALNYYLSQNGKTVDEEMQKHLAELYEQEVPENVRQFIKFQSGEDDGISESNEQDEAKPSRRQRNSSPKAEAAAEAPGMVCAQALTM